MLGLEKKFVQKKLVSFVVVDWYWEALQEYKEQAGTELCQAQLNMGLVKLCLVFN